MTFTEAAVEILRLVGRPLHYKKITELAIERNLLSHVGKAPELTMSSRLATMVKKDRGEEPIIKVKPGVFALRDFTPQMMALADAGDDDIDLSQIPETPPPAPAAEGAEGEASEEGSGETTPRPALPGSDVFPAEDDDDKPILAGIDDDDEEEGEGTDRRGRRRRRRRGRNEGEGAEASEGEAQGEAKAEGEGQGQTEERPRHEGRERHDRDRDRHRDRHDRDRDRDRHRRDRDGREGPPPPQHGHRDAPRLPAADLSREPQGDDLLGRDLADAVFAVLVSESRAMSYAQIAGELVRRGRLVGDPASLVPTIAAAVRADVGRSQRARFRHTIEGLALYDWFLPRDAMYRERDLVRAAERHQETVRRSFLRKIGDLPAAGFAELIATWLNAEGVAGLRGVRRPTSSNQEMHFAGTLRRGFEELRLAIVVVRGQQELARERVVELRGSLHHYGNATLGWIVSTAGVPRPTRDEATAQGATPIAIFDGLALAEAMENRGVGMRRTTVPLSVIDLDTLDALRGSPEQPLREDRREGGEPRGDREQRGDREPRGDREQRGDRGRDERGREDRQRDNRDDRNREDRSRDERRPEQAPVEGEATNEPASGQVETQGAADDKSEVRDARPEGAAAEAQDGGRRRRRRRRRRGGQDRNAAEGQGAGAEGAGEGGEDDELEGDVEGDAVAGTDAENTPAAATSDDALGDEAPALSNETVGEDDEDDVGESDDASEPRSDEQGDEPGSDDDE
ncbi:MAG: restriction endonuclease [Deltaproteobacteria bacterium]|nr:restriction endonuclease [Deltaproteobacteria bacterium]